MKEKVKKVLNKKTISLGLLIAFVLTAVVQAIRLTSHAAPTEGPKVGIAIKTVDSNGNPVSGVTYEVNYLGQTIEVGPSGTDGYARSNNDTIQLFNTNRPYGEVEDVETTFGTESMDIIPKSWPSEYTDVKPQINELYNPNNYYGYKPDDNQPILKENGGLHIAGTSWEHSNRPVNDNMLYDDGSWFNGVADIMNENDYFNYIRFVTNVGSMLNATTVELKFIANVSTPQGDENDDPPIPEGEYGSLQITKKVAGGNPDINKNFNVKITLSDNTINGTYGDVIFENGIGTLKIKHNDTKTITNLPAGITYEIEENADDYKVEYINQNGSILKDQTAIATITNTLIYTLTFKKVDFDTGEELHDWELSFNTRGSIIKINENNNTLRFEERDNYVYLIGGYGYYADNWISFRIDEPIAPKGYYTTNFSIYGYMNTPASVESLINIFNNNKGYYYDFEVIDDHNGIIKVKDKKTRISVRKIWDLGDVGQSIYNEITREYEWKTINYNIPYGFKATSTFEITFDNLDDGEYELVGANEDKLVVKNNKATFSQTTDIKSKFYYYSDTSGIVIKGIPVDTHYSIEEIEATDNKNKFNWAVDYSYSDSLVHSWSYSINEFRNIPFNKNDIGIDARDTNNYKLNLTKKVINGVDEDREYEFTIMPLFGYAIDSKTMYNIRIPGEWYYGNYNSRPGLLYSVWLHGEDGNKIVNKEWFATYLADFWQYSYPNSDNTDERMIYYLTNINRINMGDAGFLDIYETRFAEPNFIEQMVNNINENTNNFFEYDGKHIIQASIKLQEELHNLGYNTTQEWFDDIYEKMNDENTTEKEKLQIADEFCNAFTNAGWTVDDFRFLRVMAHEGLSLNSEDFNYSFGHSGSIYDYAQEIYENTYNSWCEWDTCPVDFRETLQYIYGRTFTLKDGESIELNFPAAQPYEYGFLILEKKTEDMDYNQDYSVMLAMQHVEKEGDDLVANVTYKNSYPKDEEPVEEYTPKEDNPKKEEKPKKENWIIKILNPTRKNTPLTIDRIISYIVLAITSVIIITGMVIRIFKTKRAKN